MMHKNEYPQLPGKCHFTVCELLTCHCQGSILRLYLYPLAETGGGDVANSQLQISGSSQQHVGDMDGLDGLDGYYHCSL